MKEFTLKKVPVTIDLKSRVFKGKPDLAMQDCLGAGNKPLYMPDLVDALVQVPSKDIPQMEGGYHGSGWPLFAYDSLSLVVTGTTKGKNKVVVYVHAPHYFSNPDNIAKALTEKSLYHWIVYNGARLPNEEFERLLNLEDGINILVVDYDKIDSQFNRSSSSQIFFPEYDIEKIIEHPSSVPALAGERRVHAFVHWYKQNIGGKILVEPTFHFTPKDSFFPEDGTSVARFLHIGVYAKDNPAYWDKPNQPSQRNYLGFGAEVAFDAEKYFVGVPDLSQIHFTLEEMLSFLTSIKSGGST